MRRQGQQRQRERLHQPRLGGRVARQLQRVRHQRLHAGPPQARLHALARGRPVGRHHTLLLQHHDRQGHPRRPRGRIRPPGTQRVERQARQMHCDPERHDRWRPAPRRTQERMTATPAAPPWLGPRQTARPAQPAAAAPKPTGPQRIGQGQRQRRVAQRPAPLVEGNGQRIARHGRQPEPQHRRRRLPQRLYRTEHPDRAFAGLRQHLQPAQHAGRAWSSQSSTPPNAWLRRICSAAHSRSDGLAARTQTICSGEKSQPTSRTALGRYGGPTRAMRSAPAHSVDSAGRNSRHSPIPGCGHSSSVSPPSGQPPPGSSASSASWPVASTRPTPRARLPARHSAGCSSSGDGTGRARGSTPAVTGPAAASTTAGGAATSLAEKRDGDCAGMKAPQG